MIFVSHNGDVSPQSQKVAFLFCIRSVPASNISRDPYVPSFSVGFRHSLHVNTCSQVAIPTELWHTVFNCTHMYRQSVALAVLLFLLERRTVGMQHAFDVRVTVHRTKFLYNRTN